MGKISLTENIPGRNASFCFPEPAGKVKGGRSLCRREGLGANLAICWRIRCDESPDCLSYVGVREGCMAQVALSDEVLEQNVSLCGPEVFRSA